MIDIKKLDELYPKHLEDHVPDTTKMIPYSVYIDIEDARVCFSIGNQCFALGFEPDWEIDCPVIDQLEWMKQQLEIALASLAGQGWRSVENVTEYLDELRGGVDD